MNRSFRIVVGAVLSLFACVAHAQAQSAPMPLKMDSTFYAGAGVGRSEAREICNVGGACDPKDVSWTVFAGYRFHRNFAVEGGYTDLGHASTTGFVGGAPVTLRSSTTAWELTLVGIVPLTNTFSLYGKAGFFRYDSDGATTGVIAAASADKGTEFTFGLGAEYLFLPSWAARLEWQRYFNVGSGIFGIPTSDIQNLRVSGLYKF